MSRKIPILLTAQKQIIRVLIVEDEYILAVNLKEELEALGYHVLDIINTAEAAIDKAAELRPNLILMDIRLQGEMDGVEAAERIWNLYQIPIIYVTGHSDQKTVERATLTLPFGYIIKPVKEVELHVAIQTALSRYEREQFLSTVLRGIGDGVVVVDTQQRVQYLNPVAETLTHRSLDRVKGQRITDTFPLINEQTKLPLEHPVVLALQQETTIYMHGNMLLKLPDGGYLPICDSVAPVRDNQGQITGAVFVFRDDTQRRLIEERNLAMLQAQHMEAQVEELKRLNQLKDDFLATTSHELRTPLASIKLAICMLETVLDQCGVLNLASLASSQSVTRYLTILRDQCDQELRLVNDLLDMRSLEADAYPLEPTEIALQHWLPHLCETFQERAIAHQQTLEVIVPPDLPALVSDLPSLTRILSELLNNACKYTPSHERIEIMAQRVETSSVDLSPSATPAKPLDSAPQMQIPQMQITVRNSGIEIAADQLIHIFEPFYRIPQRDRWKHEGTGLGLALAAKFVHYLQGSIAATSSQNWVTFTVQLPLYLTQPSDRLFSND